MKMRPMNKECAINLLRPKEEVYRVPETTCEGTRNTQFSGVTEINLKKDHRAPPLHGSTTKNCICVGTDNAQP